MNQAFFFILAGFLSTLNDHGIAKITLQSLKKPTSFGATYLVCREYSIKINAEFKENTTVFYEGSTAT